MPQLLCILSAFLSLAAGTDLLLTADATWAEGSYSYDNLTIASGATLTIGPGSVEIWATHVWISSGATISGVAMSHASWAAPSGTAAMMALRRSWIEAISSKGGKAA